jgi:hypothetical protein
MGRKKAEKAAHAKPMKHKFFIETRNLDELITDILLALEARNCRAQGE